MRSKKKIWIEVFLIFLIFLFIYLAKTLSFSYYLSTSSTIVLIFIMLLVDFEFRQIKALELSILALMTGLAVGSRLAFAWLPYFKPIGGLIVISGLAFGPTYGFFVGAFSMLISNMFFGQGPWTPWQMLAFGILGFLASLIKPRFRKRLFMTLSSFFLIVLVTGPILDTSSVLFYTEKFSFKTAVPIYLAGLPVNIYLGLSTGLFIFLFGEEILFYLEKLKGKYKLFENK